MEPQITQAQTTPEKKKNSVVIVLSILLVITLFISAFLAFRINKVSKQNTELKSLAVQLAVEKAERKNKNETGKDTIQTDCEVDRVYQSTATVTVCDCPEYTDKVILSTEFGPCPIEGMKYCPATTFKCTTEID